MQSDSIFVSLHIKTDQVQFGFNYNQLQHLRDGQSREVLTARDFTFLKHGSGAQ